MVALVLISLGFLRALWNAARRDVEVRALLTITVLVILVGALFYWRVEGWSLFDSFYFCFMTLATVGYGDFTPQTVAGKAFTMVYVLVGIGVLFAFIQKFAAHTLANIEERRPLRRPLRGLRGDREPPPAPDEDRRA